MATVIVLAVFFPLIPMYSFGFLFGICILHAFVIRDLLIVSEKELDKTKHQVLVDALTGTYSKHAYVDVEDEVDRKINEKTMENDVYDRFNALVETNRQLISSREETKRMQILANQDGLTGVHNKVAYNSEVERINKDIENGEKVDFAVVMIDLNYLKEVNDTYGHEAGDEYLVASTKLIAEYYKGVPVYRIGGDEFVALLKDENYEKRQELFDAFNERIEKNRVENQRVIVPSGLAEFDPKLDTTITKVFTRADRRMYERKQKLKETT